MLDVTRLSSQGEGGLEGARFNLFQKGRQSTISRALRSAELGSASAAIRLSKVASKPPRLVAETKQVGVGHLLMPHQAHSGKSDCPRERQFIGPELVVLGGGVSGENLNCFAGLNGVAGKGGIGNDTNETSLSERASRPTSGAVAAEPLQCQVVPLVAGPQQRDQQVRIKQAGLHAPSASIRRTSSVVTGGESAGNLKTTIPPLFCEGVGALRPRRMRSDTVLPSEAPRSLACRAAISRMSSSKVSVVLMLE